MPIVAASPVGFSQLAVHLHLSGIVGKVTAICCGVLFVVCASAQTTIPHLLRIDDHVYRGRQPRPQDYAELKHIGIKTVLDLRGGWIHRPHEAREVHAAGMEYKTVRLSGIWEPHDNQMAAILAVLEDPGQVPVFIHCRRGDDRTGLVIACYRIAHDHWTNQQALAEARHDGLNILEFFMRRYVQHFDAARAQSALPTGDAARASARR